MCDPSLKRASLRSTMDNMEDRFNRQNVSQEENLVTTDESDVGSVVNGSYNSYHRNGGSSSGTGAQNGSELSAPYDVIIIDL